MASNKYYLKYKDMTLIEFKMDNTLGLNVSNIKIINDNKDIFPIKLKEEVNEENILSFINSRVIPKNRAFVENILSAAGLSLNDKKGIIDISKGLSLIDSYWIVDNEKLQFKDYNLFDNDFSEVLSLVAFTGYSSKVKDLISSPEFSTNGMLPKAWRRIDGSVYLYKGSTASWGTANTGCEPYSEFYASQVAEKLGYNHVFYDLDKWKNEIASVCPLFTSKDVSYVQIADVVKGGGISAVYDYIKELGFEKEFSELILFDAVVGNLDRHFGNFGLLRDNNTGNFISLAPIFDNGESLLSKEMPSTFVHDEEFKEVINSSKYMYSYYGATNEDIIKAYCFKEQIKDLRKLLDFKIVKHPKYNLDDNRIKRINEFIRIRAREYIKVLEEA